MQVAERRQKNLWTVTGPRMKDVKRKEKQLATN